MGDFQHQRKVNGPWKLIGRYVVSFISLCFTHFALFMASHLFLSSSVLSLLSLSVVVLLGMAGIARCSKSFLGLRGSAPAFVFMNIVFIWCVYIVVIRQAISPSLDIIFNAAVIMLLIGLYSILSSDPGFVKFEPICREKLVSSAFNNVEGRSKELELSTCGIHQECSSEESLVSVKRVRYCKHCKAHVKGFDHHCPAFGNCIGQNNHVLFIVLLAGFVIVEGSYIACSSQIATARTAKNTGKKTNWTEVVAISTMMFSILQVLWQVVFFAWHIYCKCFNITTDEWINWKKYPEFQHVQSQPGQPVTETRFINPYDKGILQNLREFIKAKG